MRTKLCLASFNNYKNIKFNTFPTTYTNKYYGKIMDLKVCDFFWACSRKSYLPCGEIYDVYSYDSIINCLKAGARLINLDIYSDEKGNPIVRDKYPMPRYGKPLNLELCLKLIERFSWISNQNYPLILFLGIHTNNRLTLFRLTQSLKNIFHNRFLNKKYGFSGRNGAYPISQTPIKDLMGKVTIIVDKYPLIGILNELVNGEITKNQQFITSHLYTKSIEQFGGLISKKTDIGDMVNYNKFNITLIESSGITSPPGDDNYLRVMFTPNVRNPKEDIYNAPPHDCWKYGCQWVLMNYQLYDENMKKYIDKFQNGGLILKPDNLRYIPKPPVKIVKQNPKLFFEPKTISKPGWYNVNV